ncbi:MAG: hypothetical protein GC179_10525 [Anaerolineaceae bacterium]|nr:hypothetical protein [Anaerolineaceae bacterium]
MTKIIKVCLTLSLLIYLFSGKAAPISAVGSQNFPSKLLFYTDSDVTTNQVLYVDPQTLDLKRLLLLQEHEYINGAFWSPDGKNFAVIIQRQGQRIKQVCIYSEARIKTQCLEIPPLWSRSTISFPTHKKSSVAIFR